MARNSSAAARRGSLQAGAAPVSVSTAARAPAPARRRPSSRPAWRWQAPRAGAGALQHRVEGPAGGGQQHSTDRPGRRPVAPAHRRRRATAPSTRRPAPATGRPRAWPAGACARSALPAAIPGWGCTRRSAIFVALVCCAPMYCGATATPMPSTARAAARAGRGAAPGDAGTARARRSAAGSAARSASGRRPGKRGRAASWAHRAATMLRRKARGR